MKQAIHRRWRARALVVPLVLVAVACQSSPPTPTPSPKKAPEDPAVVLRRNHDQWWSWLAANYDKNHDGRIEASEYGRDATAFARLDRDHDGVVTRADFERDLVLPADLVLPMVLIGIASGGRDVDSIALDQALAAMQRLDANGNGRVDRAEFEAAVPSFMNGVDTYGTLLAGMDEDRDGLLSLPEIERWMVRRDTDHDGRLVRRERMVEGPPLAEGFIRRRDRQPAPDFAAAPLAGGAPVPLSSLVGKKPVALIFGSFT